MIIILCIVTVKISTRSIVMMRLVSNLGESHNTSGGWQCDLLAIQNHLIDFMNAQVQRETVNVRCPNVNNATSDFHPQSS